MSINFRDKTFLSNHIKDILSFYQNNVLDDENGGFHHNFFDDGSLIDTNIKHLVSSTRMVFNYAKSYELFKEPEYLAKVEHGLSFIKTIHFDEIRQAYSWVLDGIKPIDKRNYTYGLAFVMLAYSSAISIGLTQYKKDLEHTWRLLEEHFWLPGQGLYADEASADWSEVSRYRGQNSNMHMCEACLAAYEATADKRFIDRAITLAKTIVIDLGNKSEGLIWEHYTQDLEIDWNYNKDDPKNLYKPWGFQPGHLTEWAKLLLGLYEHINEIWLLQKAIRLFDSAIEFGWDRDFGGLYYGFAPDKTICDNDKYFWVQAETLAAAALLAKHTKDPKYWDWYDKLWSYCWINFVDHHNGAWFRVLNRENEKYSNRKSEAGSKCDYHTLGACYSVLKQ